MEPTDDRSVGIDVMSLLDGIGVTGPAEVAGPIDQMKDEWVSPVGDAPTGAQSRRSAPLSDRGDSGQNAQLLAWEIIGAPLFLTVLSVHSDPQQVRITYDEILALGLEWAPMLAEAAGADRGPDGDEARWRAAVSSLQIVSGYVGEHGKLPDKDFLDRTLESARAAFAALAGLANPVTEVADQVDLVEALSKVGLAVARYSFNQTPEELGLEVMARLQTLAGGLGADMAGIAKCLSLLARAYANSHHQEVDALLDMEADEREAYAVRNQADVLAPIWARVEGYAAAFRGIGRALAPRPEAGAR